MDPSTWYIVILISLVCSAFFSGMEIAFISANKLSIELDKNQGNQKASIISMFTKRPTRFIGTMLLGNNVALVIFGIGMANVLEPEIIKWIGNREMMVLLIQTIISTLIVLTFAEFLPKSVFRINPYRTLRIFVYPLVMLYYLLWIFVVITIGMSEGLLRIFFGMKLSGEQPEFGRVDLDHYVSSSLGVENNEENIEHEIHIFKNALQFKDVIARDCMVPRTEIIALDVDDDVSKLKDLFVETGLSKILIYRDSIDNIIGYAHSFELFKNPESIKTILLPIGIIPESKAAQAIMEELTLQKRSIAVVVDEFGGTSGIVTIEDVMEEIFGEIVDEHDSEESIENQLEEGLFEFSARLEIDYINDKYKLGLPNSEEYETLAGFILNFTETIPTVGEEIQLEDFDIKIIEASHTKIETVKLRLKSND